MRKTRGFCHQETSQMMKNLVRFVSLHLAGADGGEKDEGGAGRGGQRVRRCGAQALELPVPRYTGHFNT
jgi:hypothetical protein